MVLPVAFRNNVQYTHHINEKQMIYINISDLCADSVGHLDINITKPRPSSLCLNMIILYKHIYTTTLLNVRFINSHCNNIFSISIEKKSTPGCYPLFYCSTTCGLLLRNNIFKPIGLHIEAATKICILCIW